MKYFILIVLLGCRGYALEALDLSIFKFDEQRFVNKPIDTEFEAGDIADLQAIAPSNHYRPNFADNQLFQKISEQIILNILNTPSGAKFCKDAFGGNPLLLQYSLGFSFERSQQLVSTICSAITPHPWPTQAIQSARQQNHFPRKFRFYLYSGPDHAIESWSNNRNQTFIFVNKANVTERYLYQAFIHEMSQFTDNLSAYGNLIDKGQPGGEGVSCEIFKFVRHPLVRLTFSELRAFKLEAKILKDLNLEPSYPSGEGRTCTENFRSMYNHLEKLDWRFFASEYGFYSGYSKRICGHQSSDYNAVNNNLLSDAYIGRMLHLNDLTRPDKALCDVLSLPDNRNLQQGNHSYGPRPRVGDGGGG